MPSMFFFLAATAVPVATALDNGFTAPPMGWSALYGAPFAAVNETIVWEAAEGLATGGLSALGYRYVNLDDWYATRDATTGQIEGAANFPSGMRATADKIHSHDLLFGVYSAASQRTCGNWSASLFQEGADADTFAHNWTIDFLKYDSCLYTGGVASRARYLAMSRALNATGRKIFYSVEGWSGTGNQGNWGPEYANMWRTGNDIWPRWDECILNNLYTTNAVAQSMVPGKAWNDPDMLQPPGYIPGRTATPGLTFDESRAQFVLWAAMKAPLILGVNYATIATLSTDFPEYYNVIANEEIISIDQDISEPAVLRAQMPSKQQQLASAQPLKVTLQTCDKTRIDQQWVDAGTGQIQAKRTGLCLTGSTVPGVPVNAMACATSQRQQFSLKADSRLNTAPLLNDPAVCLASGPSDGITQEACIYPDFPSGTLPPMSDSVAPQFFIWDELTGQIVTAESGECLTLGQPNIVSGSKWVTNNGTLHHEVWTGPLSSGKQVVVLFNKGDHNETITASRDLLDCSGDRKCAVRDVLARKDLAPLVAGASLEADVPTHGVQLFLISEISGPKKIQ